jgi:predicted metal-dependent hydrolase
MPFNKTFTPTPEELAAACQKPLHPDAETGIRLFNEGKYFVAHEELELAWHAEPHPDRRLYQGHPAGRDRLYARPERLRQRGVFDV